MAKKKKVIDEERFSRQCSGDDRDFTPEDEESFKQAAQYYLEWEKKFKKKKLTPAEQILTKLYNRAIYKKRYESLGKEFTSDNTLLEIDDWSKVTPQELQHQIDNGAIVDWVDGYDVGPSPLTEALQQGASSEIIGILVANGANVDMPTVLPSGTKVTPLEIVRLQPATHDNLQKELLLLRVGAKDNVITWLKHNRHKNKIIEEWFQKGKSLRKSLRFLGYKNCAKVFEYGFSFDYIMEHAENIWDDADFDIYDKGVTSSMFSVSEIELLYNELGDKFAKRFFAECDKMLPNVAMHEYYMYLSSLYMHNKDEAGSIRISAAARDLRNNYFTKKDWKNLIAITHNITAKAEYSKMMKGITRKDIAVALNLDFSQYQYYMDLLPYRCKIRGRTTEYFDRHKLKWLKTKFDIRKKFTTPFGGDDVDMFEKGQEKQFIDCVFGFVHDNP